MRLTEYLEKINTKPGKFSALLNMNQSYLGRIMGGKAPCSPKNLARITEVTMGLVTDAESVLTIPTVVQAAEVVEEVCGD